MFRFILSISLLLTLFSCRKDEVVEAYQIETEFVVIGHAYGNPLEWNYRLYKKLPPILSNYNKHVKPDKFIFTGDVVAKSIKENWDLTKHQLDSMELDYWIAPGNHDLGSDYFQNNIQSELYFTAQIDESLFIILNTNHKGWTVDSTQQKMIQSALANLTGIKNIFVFTHQVWWANTMDASIQFDPIKTNSKYNINGPSSFWTDALPLFYNVGRPVYFFSGDVGAVSQVPAYSENHHENLHFYASGVGGAYDDNILHVKAYSNGYVEVEKVDF